MKCVVSTRRSGSKWLAKLVLCAAATCACAAENSWSCSGITSSSFLANSLFRLHHRHGAYTTGSEEPESHSQSQQPPTYDEVMSSLVKILSSQQLKDNISGDEQKIRQREQEAILWRQLGKIQLDAFEYAEAARIFRYGSKRCPEDDGLLHHVKVFGAFHSGEADNDDAIDDNKLYAQSDTQMPDLLQIPNDDEVFLVLDLPPDKVPLNIQQFSGVSQSSQNAAVNQSLTQIICASKSPILSMEACQFLISSAKEAAKRRGGWTTDRHIHAPTCDIPVFDLHPSAVHWVRRGMTDALFPLIASAMPEELALKAEDLRIQDCFVVRYDGEEKGSGVDDDSKGNTGYASLRPHEDESLISLTIALNDMNENVGGGLFVASTGDLLNGDAGTVLCFAGGIVHGGYPVSRGTRWILTVFIYIDKNLSGKDAGYALRDIESQVDDANRG